MGEGYCSVDDIEKVLTEGLARRWAFMGPFEVAHLGASNGYRSFMQSLGSMMRAVTADAKVDYCWDDKLVEAFHQDLCGGIPVSEISARQEWRDRRLMALTRFLTAEAARGWD